MSWVRIKDKKPAPDEHAPQSDTSDFNRNGIKSTEKKEEAQTKTPKLKFSRRISYNSRKVHKRSSYGYQRASARSYHGNQNTAKRIRVSNNEADDPSALPINSNDSPQHKSTLTKFAYRSVFPKDLRPRKTKAQQSTSLVRVANNEAPICPSILRCVKCTNIKCKKRHDVPRKHAMPDCSFFQKGGMCFKEDCIYRHVKVNENAEVCPNFVKKGFCDNELCVLRHVKQILEIS